MPEGLSPTEVGKELGEHAERHQEHRHRHDRLISIAEAVLLSIVTITAAWSGYSAAKWNTESRLHLAKGSTVRAKANRAFQGSLTLRAQDAANFNAWFAAYLSAGAAVAEKRFRTRTSQAWLATRPTIRTHLRARSTCRSTSGAALRSGSTSPRALPGARQPSDRSIRIGLVVVGAGLLIFAGIQLLLLPGLPA